MWELQTTDEYERSLKWYAKKRPRELRAVLDNLDTYLQALRAGAKPQHKAFGFQHAEQQGVWAIDQKGGGPSLAQTRLYVYPDSTAETLYLIALGDKGSQQENIKTCNRFVTELLKRELPSDESAKEEPEQAGGEPLP